MLAKEEADKIMQIKGNVRGGVIQADFDFVRQKEGEEGVRTIERKMAELGYPFKIDEIGLGGWYLEAFSVLLILLAKDLFNWTEKDIFEMGNSAPKSSFISKIFMRYFLSFERVVKEIPNYWKKHFDFGELEPAEFNEKKGYLILREKGYKFHPLLCVYHSGYYLRIAQFIIKTEKINIEETKCMFKGDPYHEYAIRWLTGEPKEKEEKPSVYFPITEELTKEVVQKLMTIKGEARGVTFKTDIEYILMEKGEEGLKKLEEELEKLGCPIKYKEIETMNLYPIGLRAISLLAIKKVFGFDNEKIKEMGVFATKVSLIIKLFMKYFLSIQRVFSKESPKIWQKHFTIGELIPVELNEKEKYSILRLKDFNLHPIYCIYLGGYFCGIQQMLVKSPQITFEERKCSFRGDEYHEYLLKWK